jgi:transposase
LKQTRILSFSFDDVGLVIDVCPTTAIPRCSGCGARSRKIHDRREREWRHLDLAGMQLSLRYELRRADCFRCGVVAELVPWAEHGAGFTSEFEQTVAYLAQRSDQSSVSSMLRIAWPTVGRIVTRVVERLLPGDRLDGLTHIGVDELSYRRHHEYVTVVVDHIQARVVWVRPGKNADTLREFFADLGPERAGKLEAVTIDMSGAYIQVVTTASPQAQLIFDRFHVQRLAHDALDQVRRDQVRDLHEADDADGARALKKTRFALHKNPWNLTGVEAMKIVEVQRVNRPLYRAYLLKETLAAVLDGRHRHVARTKLDEWTRWAARSKLAPFQKLARTVRKHKEGILAYVASRLSNGRTEGINGKIRTITRRAYGFHDASSLIGLIFLCCSRLDLTPAHKTPRPSFH